MQFNSLASFIVIAVLALSPFTSRAAIVDHGSFLSDTETGLDWLDVTATINKSYDQVALDIKNGVSYANGWKYANGNQFNTLIANATETTPPSNLYQFHYFPQGRVEPLMALLGVTGVYAHWSTVYGLLDDFLTPSAVQFAVIYDYDAGWTQDFSVAHGGSISPWGQTAYIGSFLVRDTLIDQKIPEPGTSLLTTLALFCIVLLKFRNNLIRPRPIQ